jgi:hypothetical protein
MFLFDAQQDVEGCPAGIDGGHVVSCGEEKSAGIHDLRSVEMLEMMPAFQPRGP